MSHRFHAAMRHSPGPKVRSPKKELMSQSPESLRSLELGIWEGIDLAYFSKDHDISPGHESHLEGDQACLPDFLEGIKSDHPLSCC